MEKLYCVTIINKRTREPISDDAFRYIEGFEGAIVEKLTWEREGYAVDLFEMDEADIKYILETGADTATFYTKKPLSLWLKK